MSTILFDAPNDYVWGFNMGVVSEVTLSRSFYLSPQLSFITKGQSVLGTNVLRLQYLVLPVLAGYRITKKLDLLLGPQAGLLLNARLYPSSIKDQMRSFDFEILGDIRYRFNRRSGIDFSFSRSIWGIFYNVEEKNNPGNQTFQLSFFLLVNV
jgi:hypothetical protein